MPDAGSSYGPASGINHGSRDSIGSIARAVLKQAIPAVITVALQVSAGPFGFGVLPFSESIQREFWFFPLICGLAASMIAIQQFGSTQRDFTTGWLAATLFLFILCLVPSLVTRFQLRLGLDPVIFSAVSVLGYVVLGAVLGFLVGGAVSAVLKTPRLS